MNAEHVNSAHWIMVFWDYLTDYFDGIDEVSVGETVEIDRVS